MIVFFQISVVSKHGHIRHYDTRSKQRRPVLASEWADEAPTSCASLGADKLIVGAGTGKLAMFDSLDSAKKLGTVSTSCTTTTTKQPL